MDIFFVRVYDLCMMLVMVKEADLDRIEVREDYEVLDATALGRRLRFKRNTVLAYLSRCLPTSEEGTSAAYLGPTAYLRWDPSGTRRTSESGKQRRKPERVASRSAYNESGSRGEGEL